MEFVGTGKRATTTGIFSLEEPLKSLNSPESLDNSRMLLFPSVRVL